MAPIYIFWLPPSLPLRRNLLNRDIGMVHTPGSSSLFAETVHSCVDTINQAMLAVGIERSKREADAIYNYGKASGRALAVCSKRALDVDSMIRNRQDTNVNVTSGA